MSDRDHILNQLRKHARPTKSPDPWVTRRDYDDLATTFCESFIAAGGEAKQVADLAVAQQEIATILEELEVNNVMVNGDLALTLPAQWPQIGWHIAGQSDDDIYEFAKHADVGITNVSAALAETGSVIIDSGPQLSRMTSLLPPVHIALVPRSRLTTDIFTWTAARAGQPPTNTVLISGPSKSADIGMTLTTGVHGPGRIIALVYDD